ncbi:hypothetical protein NL676_034420 [Syzygium grande]|nr:hypothetical protein NL676_034420 [Syzygium grande]
MLSSPDGDIPPPVKPSKETRITRDWDVLLEVQKLVADLRTMDNKILRTGLGVLVWHFDASPQVQGKRFARSPRFGCSASDYRTLIWCDHI